MSNVEIICSTVPDPHSITLTSSGVMVLRGSDVAFTCSVQMNQTILTSELSLLMMNVSLIKPDGSSLDIYNPVISGKTYSFTTRVISFGDTDFGNYTCTVTVRPQSSSTFLIGMSKLESNPIEVLIGK